MLICRCLSRHKVVSLTVGTYGVFTISLQMYKNFLTYAREMANKFVFFSKAAIWTLEIGKMKNEIGKKERSKCSTHQDMQVGAGGDGGLVFGSLPGGILGDVPVALVDGFAEAEIQRYLRMSLPFEAHIRSAA